MALYHPLLPEFIQDMFLFVDYPVICAYGNEQMISMHRFDMVFTVSVKLKYRITLGTYIPVIQIILAYWHGGTVVVLDWLVPESSELFSFHSLHPPFRCLYH